jgi:hypothetical protein
MKWRIGDTIIEVMDVLDLKGMSGARIGCFGSSCQIDRTCIVVVGCNVCGTGIVAVRNGYEADRARSN